MMLQNDTSKPYVALFLDVDGVLGPAKYNFNEATELKEIAKNLSGETYHPHHRKYCKTCSKAQAHFLKKDAIQSLNNLIEKIKHAANVHIIISSTCRLCRGLDDLKEIFQSYDFSPYIIDKTIDNNPLSDKWKEYCFISHEGKNLDRECRASQIQRWTIKHSEYAGFIVFDDRDDHLPDNFGDKFISTDHKDCQILKPEDCKKAYISIMNQLGIIKNDY